MVVLPTTGRKEDVFATSNIQAKNVTTRPRPPALWSVHDVVQWFRRHCGNLGANYSELFLENNVNGRTLLRMNATALERMGITNPSHRQEIHRELLKLKFKSDILELRDLESQIPTHK